MEAHAFQLPKQPRLILLDLTQLLAQLLNSVIDVLYKFAFS